VGPIALQDVEAIAYYMDFLADRSAFPVVPVDREILVLAAQLRAVPRIGLADAIHVATAIQKGCTFVVTDDRAIRLPPDIEKRAWTGSQGGRTGP
jgi:predicted nucleic acid-binding protein